MKSRKSKYPRYGDCLSRGKIKITIDSNNFRNFAYCGSTTFEGNVRLAFKDASGNVWALTSGPVFNIPGEKNINAKLTDNQVRGLLVLSANGTSNDELGKQFGLTSDYVRELVLGKARRSLDRNNLLRDAMMPEYLVATKANVTHAGERKGKNKLTPTLAAWAREQFSNGKPIAELCDALGVTRGHLRKVIGGKAWA